MLAAYRRHAGVADPELVRQLRQDAEDYTVLLRSTRKQEVSTGPACAWRPRCADAATGPPPAVRKGPAAVQELLLYYNPPLNESEVVAKSARRVGLQLPVMPTVDGADGDASVADSQAPDPGVKHA